MTFPTVNGWYHVSKHPVGHWWLLYKSKGKGKGVPVHAMKANGVEGGGGREDKYSYTPS